LGKHSARKGKGEGGREKKRFHGVFLSLDGRASKANIFKNNNMTLCRTGPAGAFPLALPCRAVGAKVQLGKICDRLVWHGSDSEGQLKGHSLGQ
jgi:hypothetical protein